MNVDEFIKTFKNQPIQLIYPKPSLQEAIETLCNALKEDKALFRAYKDNIAMAFQDEYNYYMDKYGRINSSEDIWTISNNAAKNFLNLLISK